MVGRETYRAESVPGCLRRSPGGVTSKSLGDFLATPKPHSQISLTKISPLSNNLPKSPNGTRHPTCYIPTRKRNNSSSTHLPKDWPPCRSFLFPDVAPATKSGKKEKRPMATEAQIKANRENAKASTGPKTPEGKAKSSRNNTSGRRFRRGFLRPWRSGGDARRCGRIRRR